MKCKYCSNELPEIIDGSQKICGCNKSQIVWNINIDIQYYKKMLNESNKKLKELEQDGGKNEI